MSPWRRLVTAAAVSCTLLATPARAQTPSTTDEGGISTGLSAAYNHLDGDIQGSMVGYEVTGTIRLLGIYWWGTNGWLFRFADEFTVFNYYEVGFWALVNVGAGFAVGGLRDPPIQFHLFFGLPIPAMGMDDPELFPGFFIEPYYRPSVHFSEARTAWDHEIGILLKLSTIKFEWPWNWEEDEESEEASAGDGPVK